MRKRVAEMLPDFLKYDLDVVRLIIDIDFLEIYDII